MQWMLEMEQGGEKGKDKRGDWMRRQKKRRRCKSHCRIETDESLWKEEKLKKEED